MYIAGYYLGVFAMIERGQGSDLGERHFYARSIILRTLLRVFLHFEGTIEKNNISAYLKRKQYNYDVNII